MPVAKVLAACVNNMLGLKKHCGFIAGHQLLKLCLLIFLVTINWQVMLNLYLCQLLFLGFAYWCEIKGLQLLLFEHGCVDWWMYTFWMLDTGRHCICVMDDQFSTMSLWWVTLFLVLAAVILASSNYQSLHSSIILKAESECCDSCGKEITTKLRPAKP